ncbi:MAG: hypothetical protein WCW53_03765 [Syntrophales bacterium]
MDAFLPIASGASQTTASRRLLCPSGLSNLFFLSFCPAWADFAPLRLPEPGVVAVVAVTCGHGNRLLIMWLLRDAADTSYAVTAASLRFSSIISPLTDDLGSLGRRTAGISCAVFPDIPCRLLMSETGDVGSFFFFPSSGRHVRDAPTQR